MRLRISIAGLLGVTLVVALAASNIVTYRRLREVEPALLKLRNEFGQLTIDDAGRLHAIQVPSFDASAYNWRIHLPARRRFVLRVVVSSAIPETGLPVSGPGSPFLSQEFEQSLSGGEVLQSIAVNKNHLSEWRLILSYEGRHWVSRTLPPEFQSWLETISGRDTFTVGKGGTVSVAANEPLILLRIRENTDFPPDESENDREPGEGIVAWIEEMR